MNFNEYMSEMYIQFMELLNNIPMKYNKYYILHNITQVTSFFCPLFYSTNLKILTCPQITYYKKQKTKQKKTYFDILLFYFSPLTDSAVGELWGKR